MIVIFSEEDDYTTYEVIKWLKFFRKKYILYNTISGKEHLNLDFELEYDNEIKLKINNCENITSIWFRRARVNLEPFYLENSLDPEFIKYINNFTREENLHLSYYTNYFLQKSNKKIIGNPMLTDVNKLYINDLAIKVGLNIPPFIITNKKIELVRFYTKHQKVIIKAIQNQIKAPSDRLKKIKHNYVEQITEKHIEKFPETFGYSHFQKLITKFCDIRVFYLNNTFYSMAIHSQSNLQTMTDFRKYDEVTPNRNSPFELPNEIKDKLTLMLQTIKMNSASIDLILTPSFEFYFLEINPVGQFGMVSFPCNYYIEREIANYL